MARFTKPVHLEVGQKVSYGVGASIGTILKRQGNDYQVEFEDGTRRWCGKNVLQPEISPEEIAAATAAIRRSWGPNEAHNRTAGAYQVKGVEMPHVRESQISVSRTSRVF